ERLRVRCDGVAKCMKCIMLSCLPGNDGLVGHGASYILPLTVSQVMTAIRRSCTLLITSYTSMGSLLRTRKARFLQIIVMVMMGLLTTHSGSLRQTSAAGSITPGSAPVA